MNTIILTLIYGVVLVASGPPLRAPHGATFVAVTEAGNNRRFVSNNYDLQSLSGATRIQLMGKSGIKQGGVSDNTSIPGMSSWQQLSFSTDGDLTLSLDFGAGESDSAAALSYKMKTLSVIEYVETNEIEGYQEGDLIVGSYNLSSLTSAAWKPITTEQTTVVTDMGNYDVWYITAQTEDNVYTVVCSFAGTSVQSGDFILSPQSLLTTVMLNWGNDLHVPTEWTTGASDESMYPNTSIALEIALGGNIRSVIQSDKDMFGINHTSLNFIGSNVNGFLSWSSSAESSNMNNVSSKTGVHHEITSADNKTLSHFDNNFVVKSVHYSFLANRPSVIYWNAAFGSNSNTTESTSSSGPLSSTSSTSADVSSTSGTSGTSDSTPDTTTSSSTSSRASTSSSTTSGTTSSTSTTTSGSTSTRISSTSTSIRPSITSSKLDNEIAASSILYPGILLSILALLTM